MSRLAVLLMVAASWAQVEPTPPRVGFLVDREGRLRAVTGVAGNFVLGEALMEGVLSAASSRTWVAAKLEREVVLLDSAGVLRARLVAPPGPALFAFDREGVPSLAYFAGERLLCRLGTEGIEAVRTLDEELAAIGWLDEERFLAAVRRGGRLELVEFTHAPGSPGNLIERLPWNGPVLILDRGRILAGEGRQIHLRRGDGTLETFALPATVTDLNPMGGEWVGIATAGAGRFALRLGEGQRAVHALPEAAP
ncbi:MAG: hypothetical protein RMI94_05345 [Bryobacterales bacterium]|nr:hypothetical protein [Bryobacterales bacterium]